MASSSPTFFITDRRMLAHRCEWDPDHIERPERLQAVLELLESEGVLDQCTRLEPAECTLQDLLTVHTKKHVERIQAASALPDLDAMETFSARHEDIYVNSASWQCALLAAGCALRATQAVLESAKEGKPAPNAFAAIRPPGHHASADAPCGFCLFNNVALCARRARAMGVRRVLIVDWDVHAGQGTQYCVRDDREGILLVSTHRYERGTFWPELPESAVAHEYPNTLNVPLNATPHGDADFAALLHQLVLPLVHTWRPGLILVSCGFDAALGDPQGEQEVSPACFGHMTGLLAQQGVPLVLLLEGGYFLPSLAQGALQCMHALLQRAPPLRAFCTQAPSPAMLHCLFANHLAHAAHLPPLFAKWIRVLNSLRARRERQPIKVPQDEYHGRRLVPAAYPTRGEYPPRPAEEERALECRLREVQVRHATRARDTKHELLELDVQEREMIRLKKKEDTVEIKLEGRDQFLCLYFFMLLPLAFQWFDIRHGETGKLLPLEGAELDRLAATFGDSRDEKLGHDQDQQLMDALNQLLAHFSEQLGPYLLFE